MNLFVEKDLVSKFFKNYILAQKNVFYCKKITF